MKKRSHKGQDLSQRSIWIVCGVAIILAIIVAIVFTVSQCCSDKQTTLTEVWGQYGDFCGGVFSSVVGFFSIVLLYKTLVSQNETLKAQEEEIRTNALLGAMQQLHSRYQYLMGIYESVVNSLRISPNDKETYWGKKAIEHLVKNHYSDKDISTNRAANVKKAREIFEQVYSSDPSFFPVYFRTIYRIMGTLDAECENGRVAKTEMGSRIQENAIDLIKMFRAQLTSYELVLLKYNAMLPQGRNSAYYIDKYNLLKHLLPLDLFEFGYYANNLRDKKDETSILLLELKYAIADVLNGKERLMAISSFQTERHININMRGDKLCVQFTHKKDKTTSFNDRFDGLLSLSQKEQKILLESVIDEMLVYSQHSKLNKQRDLRFTSNIKEDGKIEIIVESKKGNRLQASLKSITKLQWEKL